MPFCFMVRQESTSSTLKILAFHFETFLRDKRRLEIGKSVRDKVEQKASPKFHSRPGFGVY